MSRIRRITDSAISILRAIWFVIRQPRLAPRVECSLGSRHDHAGIPVVALDGSAYQRGVQHGYQLRPESQRFRRLAWSYAPLAASDRLQLPLWLARDSGQTAITSRERLLSSQLSPDVQPETQGIADGSGLPLRKVIVNTVIWEIFAAMPGSSQQRLHCSEFACDAQGYRCQQDDIE